MSSRTTSSPRFQPAEPGLPCGGKHPAMSDGVRDPVRMGWLIGRVLFAVPPHDGTVDDHPSPVAVADNLQRPTRELGRTALERSLSGLAPGGVCLATAVSRRAGGLLHHRFTLTSAPKTGGGLFSVALIPRVAPGGRYPPPCPVEPGPSSTPPGLPIDDAVARPAHPRGHDRW